MNLDLRCGLILLALYLPANSVYAATAHNSLDVNDLFKPPTFGINLFDGTSATYTFSGSTSDYINYVQLCMAGADNTCSSCGAPYATYKMLTSNNGVVYATGGTAWSIQASSIQNYLTNNGYSDGTYYVGLYVQSQDLICNYNNNNYQSYCSTSQDNAGHVLCMQAVSSGGRTTLTREDNGIAVLSSNTTPYLFINNSSPNTTSVCPAYATPFACTTTNNSGSTPTSPYGIAVDPPSKHVYVISRGSASNSLSCSISSTNGGLTCSQASFATALCSTPQGIAIDPPGEYAYVTCGGSSGGNNTVYKCALGGSTCSTITPTITPNNPTGIVIDPTNSYMYIANTSGNDLIACEINGTGCVTGNLGGNATAYVTVDNTGTYLYTGKSTGSSVYSCQVKFTNGTISSISCSNQASGATTVKGVAVNPSGTDVYIAAQGGGGQIDSCPASPGGPIISGCVSTASTGITATMQGVAWGNVVGS